MKANQSFHFKIFQRLTCKALILRIQEQLRHNDLPLIFPRFTKNHGKIMGRPSFDDNKDDIGIVGIVVETGVAILFNPFFVLIVY